MTALTDALDRLLAEHERIGSPVPRYLRPGRSPEDVRRQIASTIHDDPHPDLVALFSWRDGIDDDAWQRHGAGTGFARLFDDVHFAPLVDAISAYRERLRTDALTVQYSMEGAAQETWKTSWFPAFCQGWETYAIESSAGQDWGAIFDPAWEPSQDDPRVPRFRDLLHLVTSVLSRFQAGAYSWDPDDRFLETDRDILDRHAEHEIAEARGR